MIRKFFGDGERDFALPAKLILELEAKAHAGLGELFARVTTGKFRLADITETIRLAMIGGGTSPHEADRLVLAYIATEGNPLIEAQLLATEILTDLYVGKSTEQDAHEPA